MTKDNKQESQNTSPDDESMSLSLKDRGQEEDHIVGTIFVNPDFRIKPFLSTIAELMKLNSFNTEFELKDFARQFRYKEIKDDIRYVIENQEKINKLVPAKDGDRYYMMEMRPYRTEKGIEGVVINFVDITEIKMAKEKLAENIEEIKSLQREIIKNDVSERWRIGQFLHDDLGQSLVAMKMILQSLKTKVTNGEKELTEGFDHLISIISNSMEGVRDLSHEIIPVDIEKKGISHSFSNFAKLLEKNYGIHCEVEYNDVTMDKLKDVEIATHLYRIIQESTKNASVHGEAVNVKVTLHSDDQYLYVNISDDGTGFSDGVNKESGMGISLMRHRMELIGGTLEINNTSEIGDTGTTVSCRVSLENIIYDKKVNRQDKI